MVATLETFKRVVVSEEATREPVLTESVLRNRGIEDKYRVNVAVETKLSKLGVDT
jgi:hypothetical protein